MCQSKATGGKRCAAHTRPAYTAAMDTIKGAGDAARVSLAAHHRAAIIEHAMTPTGSRELGEAVALFEETFRVFPSTNATQETNRAELFASLGLAQTQASIRNDLEEAHRRAVRYRETGTHAVPAGEVAPCDDHNPPGSELNNPEDRAELVADLRDDGMEAEWAEYVADKVAARQNAANPKMTTSQIATMAHDMRADGLGDVMVSHLTQILAGRLAKNAATTNV